MLVRTVRLVLAVTALVVSLSTPATGAIPVESHRQVVTIAVTTAGTPSSVRTFVTAGPQGEDLLCDKFYAFADNAGEFTLQHQCAGNTAPWGYRIAPDLRAIALSPVSERGMDWTRNGVRQPRQSPHVETADYTFHSTFPNSPDGTAITYSDSYSFRHGMGSGGDVDIEIKGAFVLTGNRA